MELPTCKLTTKVMNMIRPYSRSILFELSNVIRQIIVHANSDEMARGLRRSTCGKGLLGWKIINLQQDIWTLSMLERDG